jgi:hypothetical protein
LSLFCTIATRDVVSTSKAIVLAAKEPKTKVGLLIPFILNYLKFPIYSLSITEYLFKANLTTLVLSLFKLVIEFSFYYKLLW